MRYGFTARVPREAHLRLCTINDGRLRVAGTRGDFEIDNVNGAIVMERVRGSGTARTVNGAVTASFEQVPRAASRFFRPLTGTFR